MKKAKRLKKTRSYFKAIVEIIVVLAIFVYLYIVYESIEVEDKSKNLSKYTSERVSVSTIGEQTVESVQENSQKVADVIEKVTKSVCGISKLKSTGGSILSMATESELGLGTGIVVSSDGYILSNSHVTGEKYSTCYVTIEEGNTYTGRVVWSDTDLDLSITKINAKLLEYATLGTAKNVRVGEMVYAIGNPIGFEFRRTVTSGIISAINRTIKIEENEKTSYMSDLIQTDATINPGNSGGPLIYSNGDVIGVNSVKITSAEGIGFAVPIDVVKPIINSFIEKGNFEETTLGIYVYDDAVAKCLNLNSSFSSGIYVEKLMDKGPATGCGLKEGDIINKIDGNTVKTINELREYIYLKEPGDKVVLDVTSGKYSKEIEIVLGKK